MFHADAHYIDGNERWLKGRRAIAALCGGAGETVSVVEDPSIRVYGDLAIATFHWTSVADKAPEASLLARLLRTALAGVS